MTKYRSLVMIEYCSFVTLKYCSLVMIKYCSLVMMKYGSLVMIKYCIWRYMSGKAILCNEEIVDMYSGLKKKEVSKEQE